MRILLLVAMMLSGGLPSVQLTRATQTPPRPPQPARVEQPALTSGEIAALVRECGERMTRMTGIVFYYYTYTQADIEYELDKQGQVKRERSKAYEMYPVRGRSYVRVQLSEDGRPLDPEKIERERRRATKELIEAEEKTAQSQTRPTPAAAQTPNRKFSSFGIVLTQRTSGGFGKTNLPIRPTDFLLSHEFYTPRRTTFKDRKAVLLDFRPRPNFVFDKSNVTFQEGIDDFNHIMAQLGGRVWIDAADKTVMRMEVSPVRELNRADAATNDAPNVESALGFELTRLSSGVWVPSWSWLNTYGREDVFGKVAVTHHAHKYSDFKQFSASVESEKLDPPQAQP